MVDEARHVEGHLGGLTVEADPIGAVGHHLAHLVPGVAEVIARRDGGEHLASHQLHQGVPAHLSACITAAEYRCSISSILATRRA